MGDAFGWCRGRAQGVHLRRCRDRPKNAPRTAVAAAEIQTGRPAYRKYAELRHCRPRRAGSVVRGAAVGGSCKASRIATAARDEWRERLSPRGTPSTVQGLDDAANTFAHIDVDIPQSVCESCRFI